MTPAGWRSFTPHQIAGEDKARLVIGPFGSNLKTSDYRSEGVPLVFVRDIRLGNFQQPRQFVSPEKAMDLSSHVVEPGDVLITKMGDPPGDAAVYSGSKPAIVTADCIRLRPTDDFDPRFVAYAIQAPAIRQQVEQITSGVAQRKVSLTRFRAGLSIPVPPIDEQRHIVAILEDHLSRLDAAQEYLLASERRVEAWRSGATQRELWLGDPVERPVGELLREAMRNGRSDRAVKGSEPGTRTLTLTATTRNQFTDEFTKLTVTSPATAQGLWLEPGDILVQRSNTPELVGTAARYDGPRNWAIFPDLLIRLRPDESLVDGRFLVAALRSERVHRELRARAKGLAGSMPKIDQRSIAETTVPVPSPARQQEALDRISAIEVSTAAAVTTIARQRLRAAGLRLSLLAAAFSGRLTGSRTELSRTEEIIGA